MSVILIEVQTHGLGHFNSTWLHKHQITLRTLSKNHNKTLSFEHWFTQTFIIVLFNTYWLDMAICKHKLSDNTHELTFLHMYTHYQRLALI